MEPDTTAVPASEPPDVAGSPAEGEHCSSAPIAIPDGGIAAPYPSTIAVSGEGSVITQVTMQIGDIEHGAPADLDVLLVGPAGQSAVLMSDAGGGIDAAGVTVTFADGGPALGSPLASGSYRPTNGSAGFDSWPASAPAPPAHRSPDTATSPWAVTWSCPPPPRAPFAKSTR